MFEIVEVLFGYVPSYAATQIHLLSFKLRYNINTYVFNPESSYTYVPYAQLLFRSKIPRYAYLPIYAYVPSYAYIPSFASSCAITSKGTF